MLNNNMSARASSMDFLLDFWDLEEREAASKTIFDAVYIPNVAQRRALSDGRDKTDTVSHLTTDEVDDLYHKREAIENHNKSDLELRYMNSSKVTGEIVGEVEQCKACAHCNEKELHWCAECGSAIARRTKDYSTTQSPSHSKHPAVKSASTDVLSQSSQLLPSISKPNTLTNYYSHKSNRIESSITASTSSTRHWDTSGVYMWRNQSTLKHRVDSNTEHDIDRCYTNEETCTPMTSMTTSQLLCLPNEIVLHILSHLSQSELFTCMLMCHRMYSIASDPYLWNTLLLKNKKVNKGMMINISKKRPRCLMLIHSNGRISNSVMQECFRRMNTLQTLSIDTCDFGLFTGDRLLISASIYCPHLHTVDIRWTHLSDNALNIFSTNCKKLCKVTVESIPQISLSAFKLLMLRHRRSLTHVKIHGNMSFTVRDIYPSMNKPESKSDQK